MMENTWTRRWQRGREGGREVESAGRPGSDQWKEAFARKQQVSRRRAVLEPSQEELLQQNRPNEIKLTLFFVFFICLQLDFSSQMYRVIVLHLQLLCESWVNTPS